MENTKLEEIEKRLDILQQQSQKSTDMVNQVFENLIKNAKNTNAEISELKEKMESRIERNLVEILKILETDEDFRPMIQKLREQGVFDDPIA